MPHRESLSSHKDGKRIQLGAGAEWGKVYVVPMLMCFTFYSEMRGRNSWEGEAV